MLDRLTIERMTAKAGEGPILIALSGGGDSTALLHLLAETLGPARLHAVVVDHALREGSEADAARAAGFATALGVGAEIVRLTWGDGGNRAQQAARTARYTALCEAGRGIGAPVIVTGHTRDDQAETVFIRAARGSGWRGLVGIKPLGPVPLWPEGRDLWLARPLLSARRETLRAYLGARGAAWIEDPANANTAYERVRARQSLALLEREGLDSMRFAALAERMAPRANALDAEAAALIKDTVHFHNDMIIVARNAWRGDAATRERALAVLVAAAGGAERAPGDEQTAALSARMDAPDFKAATLSGALIATWKGGWRIGRDVGGVEGRADGARALPSLSLRPNAEAAWDRRLAVTAQIVGWSVVYGASAQPSFVRDGHETSDHPPPHVRWLLAERVAHLLAVETANVLQSPKASAP